MQLFSKRNKIESFRSSFSYRRRESTFISNEIRNRLAAEIAFLASMNDFLEFFILFENERKEKIFLDSSKMDGFSLSELGYKMTDFFEFEKFAIKEFEYPSQISTRPGSEKLNVAEKMESYFDDYKLFDLIEFIILFSKKTKREDVVGRFNGIFMEENSEYEIINGMITKKTGEDLYTIKNLLKDSNLKQKIEDFRYYEERKNYLNTAKISAEIINIIFSNSIQDKKKVEIEKILNAVVCVLTSKKDNRIELYKYLDSILNNLKTLNNNIYNIRHTEKSAIQLRGGDQNIFYKTISDQNISFVEMVILSLKDTFITSENWEVIKDNYIAKYKINKDQRFIIKKPEIRLEDVPF
ncbi:MAG: hypothetical protein ACD_8C00051G0001 [uncultured bacterium]|nr:MAG: hypothetical protein ACD_8C00051G0001 [uncultured bacterium]